ncbi:ABC transporter substrate-binding protein [Thiothrix subterranea]|uniref:ABC transporter substrate-binding protein n=1 Tax=Thiothrix subterranea TaxID=2735563 RepID=UPI00192BF9AA|nr:ABC transporter substrate-binding protein [Thiothrix subterranea]QQZ30462.1 ABC transporter substrate-binding protein [Thiothrix subterranea]
MMRRLIWLGLLCCLLGKLASAAPPTLEPVTVQLKWQPQFQFAGYYAALEYGFFHEEGLDVTLVPGGSDIAPLIEVMEGRADYAIEAGDLVYYRLQGKPVVALASIFQHSPAMLMTEGKAGLRTPHDLAHKRIGMQVGGQPLVEIAAMFVNEGVTLDALALQPNRPGMTALLSGQVDAEYGYMTSEPFFNQQAGRDIHYIQPITYGVDFYGDTLFTSERHLEEHPAQVAALRRAVVRGWQYALENPDDMITVLLKRYPQLNREALQFEAARIHELVKPDIVKIGHMNSERWRRMADTFVKLGMVKDTSKLDGFLYDPDQKPDYRWLWWVLGGFGVVALLGFVGSGMVAWFNGRLQEKNTLLQHSVTAQQASEQLLQESQRSLQSLIGNLPGMAYRCHNDADWTMEFVSEGCEALTGYPAEWLIASQRLTWTHLIHPDDRAGVTATVVKASSARHPFQLSYRIQHRSCEWRWVWEQGHCVAYDAAGEPLMLEGLIMDITSQVDVQQKLQQAKEQADTATRAKSIFLANISHEIRTPLNAVTGLAQLLQQESLQGKQRDYAEKLHSSSRLLLGIVEDVMDFSCIEAGEVVLRPVPFNVRGILQSVRHIVQDAVTAKGLAFRLEVQDAIPAVLVGDPLRLSQVLNNLLINAVKFTNKGSISLHVSLQAQKADKVRLHFSVRDTGIGIPANQRESLFEPFVRIDSGEHEAVKGAGLGLSISRHLVELMGGAISVESIPGVGSEFAFSADFGCEAASTLLPDAPTPAADTAQTLLTGARILVVDDDALNLMICTELLRIFGCVTEQAENATQARGALMANTFDLVLMDIEMPGMTGDALTRQLRTNPRWQALPIIAMTAHASTTIREHCLASGMSDYLAKPFEVAQLRAMLVRWLAERASHD